MFLQYPAQSIVHLGSEIFFTLMLVNNIVVVFIGKDNRFCRLYFYDDIRAFTCISTCKKFDGIILNRIHFNLTLFTSGNRVVRTEDLYEPYEEITLEEAADYKVNPQVGDIIDIDIPTKSFGRIAAQTAKQVIIQGIREAERGMVISEFESKEHEILNATVARIDPRSGNAYLDVVSGGEKSEAVLTASEQVRGETLVEGQHVKVYLIEVRRGTRGVQVIVSRTHPGLVKRLFELEVPEIHSGVVEVKSIAREAGNRTKIAVTSHDENVDPIGACVGTRGARVSNITSELNGEKIDIIKWNEDTATFVSAALAPADVISASMQADGKSCRVIVPDDQLSLAIGKEGQNARLAAKLTGCKIDIAPKSQAQAEPQEPEEAPAEEPQTEPQAE